MSVLTYEPETELANVATIAESSEAAINVQPTTAAAHDEKRLLDLVAQSGGAWGREARNTLELASRLGVTLADDQLLYSDVRDLQAIAERLRSRLARRAA